MTIQAKDQRIRNRTLIDLPGNRKFGIGFSFALKKTGGLFPYYMAYPYFNNLVPDRLKAIFTVR